MVASKDTKKVKVKSKLYRYECFLADDMECKGEYLVGDGPLKLVKGGHHKVTGVKNGEQAAREFLKEHLRWEEPYQSMTLQEKSSKPYQVKCRIFGEGGEWEYYEVNTEVQTSYEYLAYFTKSIPSPTNIE